MPPQFLTKLFQSFIVVVSALVLSSVAVPIVFSLLPLSESSLFATILHPAVVCLVPFTLGGFLLADSWIRVGSFLALGLFVVVSAIDYTLTGSHGAEVSLASYIQDTWPTWVTGFSAAVAGLALGGEINKRMSA